MSTASLFDPNDFELPVGVTHVCAGGETPPLRRHKAAFAQYEKDKANGMAGREAQDACIERTRGAVAPLWKVQGGDIGFVANVAEGVSLVAESIEWNDGDNVCVDANEYLSVVAPFAMRRHPRTELRFVSGLGADRWSKSVNEHTRVIAVSYVSYLTGERIDLEYARKAADNVGALLIVDYTQAAGYLPIDASVADFAFSACYKWLLGITGVAVAYWNRSRRPNWRPVTAGWHSLATMARPDYRSGLVFRPDAMRFSRGNPAHGSIYVLESALDYLRTFDVNSIQRHVQTLTTNLHRKLSERGIAPSTPADPLRHGASVCIDSARAREITDALYNHGIYAWNGRGRIRFSFHGFNSIGDVDRILSEFPGIWETMRA